MNIPLKDSILITVLDCGLAELENLEDVGYDVGSIVDDLKAYGEVSYDNIVEEVFKRGARDLKEALDENREYIRDTVLEEMKVWEERVESGELTEEELEEDEEYGEYEEALDLLDNNGLTPVEDLSYYINGQDTFVYMKNLWFYEKYLDVDLENVNSNMGWSFRSGD